MVNKLFIHGLESSGHGFKGNLFRKIIPEIMTPDFTAFDPTLSLESLLKKRMSELEIIINEKDNWIIIGSSFGGLMATIYAFQNPEKVISLILLAPFLNTELLELKRYSSIDIPVIIYHGKNDKVIPVKISQERAELIFSNLTYNLVDDDHQLRTTVSKIDWDYLLSSYK